MHDREHMQRGRPYNADNPPPRRGRPKGARNMKTIVTEIAAERHEVTIDGKRQSKCVVQLILLALRNAAVRGDMRALNELKRLSIPPEYDGKPPGYLIVPAEMSMDEWIREGKIREKYMGALERPI